MVDDVRWAARRRGRWSSSVSRSAVSARRGAGPRPEPGGPGRLGATGRDVVAVADQRQADQALVGEQALGDLGVVHRQVARDRVAVSAFDVSSSSARAPSRSTKRRSSAGRHRPLPEVDVAGPTIRRSRKKRMRRARRRRVVPCRTPGCSRHLLRRGLAERSGHGQRGATGRRPRRRWSRPREAGTAERAATGYHRPTHRRCRVTVWFTVKLDDRPGRSPASRRRSASAA